jgi:hypothetical protein
MASTEVTADKPRCLGCRRQIRSAEALATGYGASCRAKIRQAAKQTDLSAWTESQVEDARQAIEDGAVVPSTRKGVFQVVSRDGERIRRTMTGGCNCEAGLKTSQPRPCWHRCAVAIVTASQAPATEMAPAPAPIALAAPIDYLAEIERLNEAFMAMA